MCELLKKNAKKLVNLWKNHKKDAQIYKFPQKLPRKARNPNNTYFLTKTA